MSGAERIPLALSSALEGAQGGGLDPVAEVREFALGIIAYERDHAAGVETPTLLAVARDLLAIVGCPDCEGTGMTVQGRSYRWSGEAEDQYGPCARCSA